MSNAPADNNEQQSPKEKPKGFLKRFYSKFRKPLKVLLVIYLILLAGGTVFSFAPLRALFYPIFALTQYPDFVINDYSSVFTTDEKPSFLVSATKYTNFEFKIFDADTTLKLAKTDENAMRQVIEPGSRRYPCENINLNKFYDETKHFANYTPVASISGPVIARDVSTSSMVVTLPNPLKPGDYVGVMSGPGMKSSGSDSAFVRFRVTDLGAIVKHDSEKVIVSTVNLITRKPWDKADVTILRDEECTTLVPAVATNVNGIATLKRPPNLAEEEWQSLIIDVKSGDHIAFFGNQSNLPYHYSQSGTDNNYNFSAYTSGLFRTFIDTDRPVYRIGQTVNFKCVVRKVTPKGLASQGAGTSIILNVTEPDGNQVKREEIRTDASGSFTGHIKASEITKTGQYQVSLTYPDRRSENFPIVVEQYRKPDFKVEITPEKEHYERGDKVRFKVQANYYFGAPLKDAKIKFHVSKFADSDSKKRLKTTPGTADGVFFKGWESDQNYYNSDSDFSKEGDLLTDTTGQAFVEFEAPPLKKAKNENPYSYQYLDDVFNVSVETTDLSRKTFTSEGSVPVTSGDFGLYIEGPESSVVKAGDSIDVRARAADYARHPVKSKKVKFTLSRWKYDQKLFEESGNYLREDVASVESSTDENGAAVASFKTKKDFQSDSYYVTAEAVDGKERIIGDVTSVWMFGNNNDYYFKERADQESFSIDLDKEFYHPGDVVKTIVKAPLKEGQEAYLFASVEGASLRQYKQVKMTGPVALVEFPIDPSYMPNAYVSASFVLPDHKPFTTSKIVKVSPANNFINVAVATDKPRYKPGETAKFTVTAKNKNGAAVPNMSLSASVVDEGIYAVLEDIKKQMYIDGEHVDVYHSIYKMIENHVSTRFTFSERYTGTPYEPPIFDGAGLMAVHAPLLALLPWSSSYNRACMDMECKMSAAPGAGGAQLAALPPPMAAPSPVRKAEANSDSLMASRATTATKQAPVASPRVRSNFLDTAAWYPSLVTGANGTASFSVKLPDDLTTWRATVSGITTGINVGANTSSVICTQDFLARLALPRFYTEYDETVISGLIHNLSAVDQTVSVSLITSPNIKLIDTATATIKIPKDGVKRQSWKVKVLAPGEAKVTLKAIGSTLADAEERKLAVRTFGYRVFFAKNGVIKDAVAEKVFPVLLPPGAKLDTGSFDLSASASTIGPVLGNFEKLIEYPYGCTEQTLSKMIPSVIAKRLSANLGVPMEPKMETMFKEAHFLAMTKLCEYQHDDGGWGWWKDDKSDAYMTAHVLEGLYLIQKAGLSTGVANIDSARSYLLAKVQTLSIAPWDMFDSENQAKAVYVLSLLGEKLDPVTRMWQLTKIEKMSPESLSYMTMAYKNLKEDKTAEQFYARLKELRNDSLEYSNWEHSKALLAKMGVSSGWDYSYRFTGVETTALALRATVMMEPTNEELLDKITRWLILERDENGWNNTKCTSAVFLALLEKELAQKPNRATNFTARLEALNKMVKELTFKKTFERGEQFASVPLVPAPGSIKLKKSGPGWLYYNTMLSYDRPLKPGEQPVLKSLPSDLVIHRDWFRLIPEPEKPGKPTTYRQVPLGSAPVKAGDMVMMKVIVDCPINVPYAMVEAFLPSGAEVMSTPPPLAEEKKDPKIIEAPDVSDHWYWWTHQDILDDRITFFASEMQSGKSEFNAYMRMEMPGTFNINPVNMEAMYTNKVHARSAAHAITVVE